MRRYGGNQSCCKLQTFLAKFVFSIPSSLISLVATQKHDSQWNPRAVSFRECIPRDSQGFLRLGNGVKLFAWNISRRPACQTKPMISGSPTCTTAVTGIFRRVRSFVSLYLVGGFKHFLSLPPIWENDPI